MATLRDVAEHAGTSIRTVSNVVNDWPHVKPELRSRVKESIRALGYEPNVAARYLRGGRSNLVALVVPEIDNPYFGELARLIIDALARRGVTVVIEQTDGRIERDQENSPKA